MDIVDKVFEGLSLTDQADKARKITAHKRKKELRKRTYIRLAAFGSVAAVIVGLITTGIIVNLPKGTSAESEIEVSFPTSDESEEKVETEEKTEEEAKPAEETPKTEEKPAATSTKKTSTKSTKKTSTPATTTTTKTVKSQLDSNGEKTDQGSSSNCYYSGSVLMCNYPKQPEPQQQQPTTPETPESGEQSGNNEGNESGENSGVTGA